MWCLVQKPHKCVLTEGGMVNKRRGSSELLSCLQRPRAPPPRESFSHRVCTGNSWAGVHPLRGCRLSLAAAKDRASLGPRAALSRAGRRSASYPEARKGPRPRAARAPLPPGPQGGQAGWPSRPGAPCEGAREGTELNKTPFPTVKTNTSLQNNSKNMKGGKERKEGLSGSLPGLCCFLAVSKWLCL